ncbi:uncharacterized protein LOC118423748 [Branchiostoma floridae]|uniref:Uncharacterized protein LOC118423748 n=1 Tax=Branchiostoma floridae TaxID=7739 RepID=A0A9J7LSX8_BRAFL|nr:uncharacterized protein LOC118423748 [Branchiostoma floridae]
MQLQWMPLQQRMAQTSCHVSLTIQHTHPRYISQCNPTLNSHLITGLQANSTYTVCLLLGCDHSKGQDNPSCQAVTTKAPGNDVSSYIPLHWQSIIATATATTLISSILGICIYKCCDRSKIYLRPKRLNQRRREQQQHNGHMIMGREIPTIVVPDQSGLGGGQMGASRPPNSTPLLNRTALAPLQEEPEYESASPVMPRAARNTGNGTDNRGDFLRPEEHHYEAASPVLTRAAKVTANEPADSGYETTEGWHKSGYANADEVREETINNNNSLVPPTAPHVYEQASPVMPRARVESRLHAGSPAGLGVPGMNNLSPPEGHYEAATPVMPRAKLGKRGKGKKRDSGPVQQAPQTPAPNLSIPTIHYEVASPVVPRAKISMERMENRKSVESEPPQGDPGHLCPTIHYEAASPVLPHKANRFCPAENGDTLGSNKGVM